MPARLRSRRTWLAGTLAIALLGLAFAAITEIRSRAQDHPPEDHSAHLTPAPGAVRSGAAVYAAHCAECHGTTGKGDGPAAFLLSPAPRDFSAGVYKIRTTETGSVPTDDDLLRSVRRGLNGTAMPAWDGLLPDEEIHRVVDHIKGFSARFAEGAPQIATVGPPIASSPESIARGLATYGRLQCAACHGSDGRGAGAVVTEFEDDWGRAIYSADLTEPWSFRGESTARDVFLRFRTGMSGTPMPSFKDAATDAEMWDLANYVLSLAREPVWEMNAAEVAEHYVREEAEARSYPVERGRHLVETMGCGLCHSPLDQDRRLLPGMKLAGGMLFKLEPFGDYITGNLTSDVETGLGGWTDDEIKRVLTQGILRDGTRLPPFPMDWPSYSTLAPADLDAIVAYLRTVPPVSNRIPPPRRPFLPVYLWGKFRMLILGADLPITIHAGNAGAPAAGGQ
jgi:mono/diheme cytochrome c family protein